MSRVLGALTVLAATVAVGAMLLVTQPNVIVVAPWPAVPMITPPVTTTSGFSVEQVEEAVISSIARSEPPTRGSGSGEPELE